MKLMIEQVTQKLESGEYKIDRKSKKKIQKIINKKEKTPKDLVKLNQLIDFQDRLEHDNMADLMAKRKVKKNLRYG